MGRRVARHHHARKSGMDVLKEMVEARPNLAVLVLNDPQDQYAVRVLKTGAAGYITKNTASEEVIGAVKKVLAGGKYVSACSPKTLPPTSTPPPAGHPMNISSDREYQVMRFIALGKSVKEIAFELSLSVKTISTYRTRIMEKTSLKTNADIIRYAMHEKLVD